MFNWTYSFRELSPWWKNSIGSKQQACWLEYLRAHILTHNRGRNRQTKTDRHLRDCLPAHVNPKVIHEYLVFKVMGRDVSYREKHVWSTCLSSLLNFWFLATFSILFHLLWVYKWICIACICEDSLMCHAYKLTLRWSQSYVILLGAALSIGTVVRSFKIFF